jgi:hypothetical protein
MKSREPAGCGTRQGLASSAHALPPTDAWQVLLADSRNHSMSNTKPQEHTNHTKRTNTKCHAKERKTKTWSGRRAASRSRSLMGSGGGNACVLGGTVQRPNQGPQRYGSLPARRGLASNARAHIKNPHHQKHAVLHRPHHRQYRNHARISRMQAHGPRHAGGVCGGKNGRGPGGPA